MDMSHRDLKPANLMLKKNPNGKLPILKIADYGFCRQRNDVMETVIGSPVYEDPEMLRGEEYGDTCDLYSVGVILYEMATRRFPFRQTKECFQYYILNSIEFEIPDDIELDEDLICLLYGLITQTSADRLNWKQFYDDKFVKRALKVDEIKTNENQ